MLLLYAHIKTQVKYNPELSVQPVWSFLLSFPLLLILIAQIICWTREVKTITEQW